MQRSNIGPIATLVFLVLEGSLLALGQGAPPLAGRLGLPAAKPAAATAPAPTTTAATNGAPSAPSTPSPAAPPQTGAMSSHTVLHGAVIKYATAEAVGGKQGQLGKGLIECLKFQFQPTVPTDATGKPTGARKLGPVTITKKYDAASIPLLQALSTNEVLTSVTLSFIDAAAAGMGKEGTAFTVKLTNATVTSVNQVLDATGLAEEVTFSFTKIDISDPHGGTFTDQTGVRQ